MNYNEQNNSQENGFPDVLGLLGLIMIPSIMIMFLGWKVASDSKVKALKYEIAQIEKVMSIREDKIPECTIEPISVYEDGKVIFAGEIIKLLKKLNRLKLDNCKTIVLKKIII